MTDASETFADSRTIPYLDQPSGDSTIREALLRASYPWIIVGAFGLYWLTFLILETHNGLASFGADSNLYQSIAYGGFEDRLLRFHPETVGLALAWMKIVGPLSAWVAPHHLLAGLFAAIGAAGVRAALSAFEVLVPRRYVLICGLIYASSLGIWYFSSIAESKILTATLTTLYIAVYLRLRERWSLEGALLLTGVLAAACFNEIVSAFLIVIPAVDVVIRRGLSPRALSWIFFHSLVAPVAMFVLEVTINSRLPVNPANLESGTSYSMFWFYAGMSDHSLSSAYGFLLNWLFFNIAAPTPHAYAAVPIWPTFFGYFEPSFANYFNGLTTAGLMAVLLVMALASLAPEAGSGRRAIYGMILPLLAFVAVRGVFFFIFNPAEVMQFSPAVALPVLGIILAPFAASSFPAKTPVLISFGLLLFATNLRFMLG